MRFDASKSAAARLAQSVAGGEHYNFRFPWTEPSLTFVRGSGQRVTDADGNEWLDFFSGFGAVFLGHGDKAYAEALASCCEALHLVTHTDLEQEVAEALVEAIPCAELIRFGVTGTEAVLSALRLSRAHTGRERFVRFAGHYHGHADTLLGGRPRSADDPVPVPFPADPRGSEGIPAGLREAQSFLLPWNDAQVLEDLLRRRHADIAAVLMEPVCINGGGILPASGYLEAVRELCTRYGVVLIFDEIVTGFRLGVGGAQARYRVTPDLATFGKAIGGGAVPTSVLAGRREILAQLAEHRVVQAGTFNGYALGIAAIRECLRRLGSAEGAAALAAMRDRSQRLQSALIDAAAASGIELVTQGPPECFYFHGVAEPLRRSADWTPEIIQRDVEIRHALHAHGILTAPLARFYPMLALDDRDVTLFRQRAFEAMNWLRNGRTDDKEA